MFKISFDFDETTKKISNIKVVSETPKVLDLTNPMLHVLDNKLQLSESAMNLIGVTANERVTITYWQNSDGSHTPIIGKSEVFTDKDGGNRVTQSNTISFRGRQRDTLLIYGDAFKVEEFKDGMFWLTPVKSEDKPNDLQEENNDLLELSNISDEEMIIEQDDFDDLPF